MTIIEMPRMMTDGHQVPERVTIHAMAEFLDFEPFDRRAYDFLLQQNLSAHYLITPSGCVQKCLEDGMIGRHAGKGLNAGNIGIEILVPGLHTYGTFLDTIKRDGWCPTKAWNATVELVRDLRKRYDLSDAKEWLTSDQGKGQWLVRHSDIRSGAKYDPGSGFDWQAFKKEVYNG